MVIKNKLKGFIIVLLLFALGCEADTYSTNREEFNTDLTSDRLAPTVSVGAAIIKNTENAVVQSTETGTVYLVRNSVSVSNPVSITGAADNLWNSVNIIFVDTNTYLPATDLLDGTYKAYGVDAAGNLSSASTNSVTVDSTAPTANLTAVTDDVGNLTGALTSGDFTDDTSLVLSGSNESGSVVIVYDGNTELGNATVSGTSWSYTASVVNGTTYQFNIKETDLAGNTSDATSNFEVTGDTSAPTATLLYPSTTLNASSSASVQSTETGTVYLVYTSVTVNSLASITGAADNLWNSITIGTPSSTTLLPVTGLINGTYKAYAVDYAGNLSSASSNMVLVDGVIPTISSLVISVSGEQNSFLNAGDVVSVTATFTEAVLVDTTDGTPTLTLAVGSTNRNVTFASGSGLTELVFQYTVQAGDTDSDGISIGANAIALNSGTIKDAAGNDATLTHSALSNNSNFKVDTTGPSVSTFTLSDSLLTVGETATVTLVLSEAVIEFSSSADITVANLDNGTASGTLSTMTSSDNITWTGTFTPTNNAEDNSNTLSLATSYTDPAGNNGDNETTSNYEVNTRGPTITDVAITSSAGIQNNFLNATDNVSMTVTYSETVIINTTNGSPTLTIVVGSTNRTASFVSGNNSTQLVFQYTIQASENDSDGISIGANALDLNSSTMKDTSGNDAGITHSAVLDNSNFKVDTTAPSVNSFALSDTAIKIGDTPTVTLVFSEAVTLFSSSADITIANMDNGTASGTLSTMSSSDSITWTGTFTPTENIEDASNTLSLANNSYTDLAGNNGPLETTSNYEVETLAPSVSSFTISDSLLIIGDTATVSLVFSEAVTGFSSSADITIANLDNGSTSGSLSTMTSIDNITWSGTFTPATDTEDATNTLSLATSYTDNAGNSGPSETTSNYAVETLAPTVSSVAITAAAGIQNNFVNAGDNVSVTATFSETIVVDNSSGSPTLTIIVDSTSRTATYLSGSNSNQLVFQYSIQDGENDSDGISIGSNALALNSSTIKDTAGNDATITHNAVSDNSNYKVDTIPPTVSSNGITSATGRQNNFVNAGDVVSVTATFSESVLVASGSPTFTLAVGSDNRTATYTSGSGSAPLVFAYTIQAGDTDTDGISIAANALSFNSGTITDFAGNIATDITHSAVSDNAEYMVDTTSPSVNSFAMSDTALKVGDNATVTLVLSEEVILFSSSADITVGNGALTTMTSSDNTTWTGTYTPTDDVEDDTNVLSLATSYTDPAGNSGASATTANYEVDTKEPTISTVAITSAAGIQNNFVNPNDNVSLTVTFSEVVVVDNSSGSPTLTIVVGSDNRTATYTSGSGNAQQVFGYMVQALYTSGENDSNGISISANSLSLNSSTIKDEAGNTAIISHSAVSNNSSYKVDTIPPTVDNAGITSATGAQNNFVNPDDVVSIAATFSETVLVVSGSPTITIVVGSANRTSTYTSGSNSTNLLFRYTIQALLTSGENDDDGISIGANALSLNSGTVTDLAGNLATDITHSAASDNSEYMVDTIPPAVNSFSMDDIEVRIGDTPTVTIVFSEQICSVSSLCSTIVLNNVDISNPNGSLSTISSSDNTTWTGTFTPTMNVEDTTNVLSLGTGYTDLAGNTGPAATTENYEVDTLAPTATFTIDDRFLRSGETATVTLTFSEPVSGFSSDSDITIPDIDRGPGQGRTSGTLSTMTSSDNETWTGTFTPTFPTTEDWTNVFTLGTNWTDVDNNTGTAATSPNYMVDDIPPSSNGSATISIASSLILYGQTSVVTVNFPEPVNRYSQGNSDTDDCSNDSSSAVANFGSFDNNTNLDNASGTISNFSATGSSTCLGETWTATFTPTNDVEVTSNTLTLTEVWTDQVGNPGFDNVTSSFEVETYRPRSAISFSSTQGFTYNSLPAFREGDNGTITVVFTELAPDIGVINFSESDISAPYVDLSTMTSSDNVTWTGTFTPVDNTTSGSGQAPSYSNVFSISYGSFTDVKTNPGIASTSSSYIVDTKAPFVDSVQVTDGTSTIDTVDGMCVPVESNFIVNFDYLMESSYITTSTSDSFCAGSIRLSPDNFSSSCVRMSSEPTTSNNIAFTLDPYDNLSYNTTYNLRVTTTAEDVLQNNLASDYDHSHDLKTSSYLAASDSEIFVPVGQYGLTYRSGDEGASWDNETCSVITQLNGVTYGNNTFVGVGASGRIVRSTNNGSSWSNPTSTSTQLNAIAFGNNVFLAVGNNGNLRRSTNNGSSWSTVTDAYYQSRNYNGVAYGNSTFVAVGYRKIIRSTNSGSSFSAVCNGISYYPSYYCYSQSNLLGIAFGNSTFVAVGASGRVLTSSDSGSNWTIRTSGVSNHLYGVAYGNSTFVAVGASGRIIRSTDDGATWSTVSSGVSATLYGVAYGNSTFMAVGSSGTILTSTNGSSWTSRTSGTSFNIKGVTFGE